MGKEICGLGIDMERISRFKDYDKNRHFYNKIFTDSEISECLGKSNPYASFAARFCAKEAVIKAIDGKINPKDIIVSSNGGKPSVIVIGGHDKDFLLSISHTDEYAIASVVALANGVVTNDIRGVNNG